MKIRSIIAVLFLTVYSIVIAHSIIPHHHHSEYEHDTQVCQLEKQQEQGNHHFSNCCVDHGHDNHTKQNHCSFNEKTILEKSRNLAVFLIPFTEIEIVNPKKQIQSISGDYLPLQILDPHCRNVKLRGPPHSV